ncbi:hypothetical protein [Lysobacter sp. 1R34A]|uniref:hypothetical protein n=1 Tax=Lysobacter sp. 1R34A TaxID=3445786 RepID=UPI003EEB9B7D
MYYLGIVLCLIGGLWIVVNAFRKSIWWGLGSLLIPFVAVIFAVMNFAQNKIPLIIYIVGIVLLIVGMPSMSQMAAVPAA